LFWPSVHFTFDVTHAWHVEPTFHFIVTPWSCWSMSTGTIAIC
jgi:hypothetical protein